MAAGADAERCRGVAGPLRWHAPCVSITPEGQQPNAKGKAEMTSTRHHLRQRRRFIVRLGHTSSFTVDVSASGFCVRLMKVLPVDTAVEGSIQVESHEVPFAGVVAWARPGARHLNLLGSMGVVFTRIPAELSRLLEPTPAPAPASRERSA